LNILKLKFCAAATLVLFLSAALAHAQQMPPLPTPPASYSFPQKETLHYSVDWRVFPAGVANIHLESDGNQVHVTAYGNSIGGVNLIFRVKDQFESWFDRQTGCSTHFAKQIQEGRRSNTTDLRLDYAQQKQFLSEKNLVLGTSKQSQGPIPVCVSDVLSSLFYAATMPLEPGKNFQFPLADAMRVVAITMKPEAREEIKTVAGTFQTIRVQPTADSGVVKNRGNIWIWYTDDTRHMPVQMRARLFWGTITLKLTSVEQK
jgi:hypothetical protein